MDINTLRGIVTLVTMVLFVLVCVKVFSKNNKDTYDKASKMALEDEHQSKSSKE